MAGAGVGDADGADAAQKRVRALQKKLRQIQQLKDKRDKEGEQLTRDCSHCTMFVTAWCACFWVLTKAGCGLA
jgi:hypothetical protein